MRVSELPGAGAEIADLDLSGPVPAGTVDRLKQLFCDRHLLVARGQTLTADDQVRISGWFGPVRTSGNGPIAYVSNTRPDGLVPEGPLPFHSDMSFTDSPLLGISLYAIELPRRGTSTLFANAAAAVDSLPPPIREILDGRRVLNIAGYGSNFSVRRREVDCDPLEPRTYHPAISPHPVTGTPVIRANGLATAHVEGLAEEESEQVLQQVFDTLYDNGNLYEHHWRVGDFVVFDNIAIHHARRDIDTTEARTLRRVVLDEREPFPVDPEVAELYQRAAGR
jgi:taurine dioxygenase